MKNLVRTSIVGVLAFAPFVAFAADAQYILHQIGGLIATLTPIVVALALLMFFWGLAFYILYAGDEKKKAEGRNIMIWGVLALFVMLSVFGIISALQTTFGINGSQQINIPNVNPAGGVGSGSVGGQAGY